MDTPNNSRKLFFRYASTRESIHSIVTEKIRRRTQSEQSNVLDSRNMLGYKHGMLWTLRNNSNSDEISEMQSISAEYSLHQDEIINHNTRIIETYVNTLSEQLVGGFMKSLYQMVGKVADSTGNSVNAQKHGGSFAKGFFEAIRKIEFGVDRYGRVTPPEIHVGPSFGTKVLNELESQPPEYHQQFEELKDRKEKAAISREAERISKYRWKRY